MSDDCLLAVISAHMCSGSDPRAAVTVDGTGSYKMVAANGLVASAPSLW